MRALVTGGAGYIGSHMVRTLLDAGHDVTVLDDLSTGHRDAVANEARFVQGDVADSSEVLALLRDAKTDAIFHFAAKSRVEESVTDPRRYFQGNLTATLGLLEATLDAKVGAFVLSSTAAVYGTPDEVPIDEEHPKRPVNPYGETKLAIERALEAYGRAYGLRWSSLRYFNAAGAYHQVGLGERHSPETHLLPIILDVARGKRPAINVYGTTWPTPDGTCIRDYIHVRDLCDAHLGAVDFLRKGGESGAFNLGTGRGHSVREVIDAARRVTGHAIPVVEAPTRAGDPAILVAKVERAARILGFQAKRSNLEEIVADAWAFMR
ncbi:UDP-glucose 4-epimerase [Labilithrix luteola]|uniref:UDP-glucose 4-epimerase n=1 Tax=Labilithrix luteola TaxID=1391654 RepID=A0A0K1PS34_9BACT|nr:UDP-glucose 4-epimerase GalE [Labilithrix luteola]AKU96327.1 UDP-glucose 4-epimerase [Labilithrix luteola]